MVADSPARLRRDQPRTVFLHIGTVKSGTTYLQALLRRNPDVLGAQGLCFPDSHQVAGVREVLEMQRSWLPSTSDAWSTLVDTCLNGPGRGAVVSVEFLSFATDAQAKTIIDSFDGADVHVILTARDLLRVVPSGWQNSVKSGRRWTFEEYIAGVMTDDTAGLGPVGRHFWQRHDLPTICRRWIDLVGADHLHLVTVPPSGTSPDELWIRFASVLGVDPTAVDTSDVPPANPSLSLAEAEFMLRLAPATPNANRDPRVTRRIFANKLVRGAAGGPNVTVPRAVQEWCVQRGSQTVEELRELGIDVNGSLEDLIPPLPVPSQEGSSEAPREVTSADLAETGVRVAAALFDYLIRRTKRTHRRGDMRDLGDADLDQLASEDFE